jgi:ABC-type transport system involved in multi-copper enzyme maturation permease subunit
MNSLPRTLRSSFHYAWLLLLVPPLLAFLSNDRVDPFLLGLLLLLQVAPLIALLVFLTGWFSDCDSGHVRRMANEFRIQIPGALLAVGLPPLLFALGDREINTWAVVFYTIGCALMGATTFGVEYEQKTIGSLLMQPFPRASIYREKLIVLGVLLSLALLETFVGALVSRPAGSDIQDKSMMLMVPVLAFCTGPILSLRTRGTLAGTVLSIATPMLLIGISHLVSALLRWIRQPALEELASSEPAWRWSGFVLCAYAFVGSWLGWRAFSQLEVKEQVDTRSGLNPFAGPIDRILQFVIPSRGTTGTAMLWRKEFRLHVVPWMITGLMVGVWVLLLAGRRVSESVRWETQISYEEGFVLLSVLFGGMTLLLTGSASISEERQLGVLDWQLTAPASVKRQWWIKVGATFALSLLLGIALPAVLLVLALGTSWLDQWKGGEWLVAAYVNGLLLFVGVAMYGSSLSRNTVKAVCGTIALSLAVLLVAAILIGVTSEFLSIRYSELRDLRATLPAAQPDSWSSLTEEDMVKWAAPLLPLPLLVVWLIAAGRNFRFGLPDKKTVVRQLAVIALSGLVILGSYLLPFALWVEWATRTLRFGPPQ